MILWYTFFQTFSGWKLLFWIGKPSHKLTFYLLCACTPPTKKTIAPIISNMFNFPQKCPLLFWVEKSYINSSSCFIFFFSCSSQKSSPKPAPPCPHLPQPPRPLYLTVEAIRKCSDVVDKTRWCRNKEIGTKRASEERQEKS